MEQLYVGVGRADITPPIGTMLMGYTPARPCESVNDPVVITVFAFAYGETKAILASADLCNLRGQSSVDTRNALAKGAGVPFENCVIACTHTHSGPHTNYHEHENFEFVQDILCPRAEQAAAEAMQNLRPAVMGVGTTQSQVAVNRRQINEEGEVVLGQNPYGPYDPTMTVIAFREPDGTVIGSLIHYGCHNTGSGNNKAVTRDWCGVAKDRLEEVAGGLCGFINGCGGDCGPRLSNGKTTGNVALAQELGQIAADDAQKAWENIVWQENTDLRLLPADVVLPLEKQGSVEDILAQAAALGDPDTLKGTVRSSYLHLLDRAEYLQAGNVPPTEQAIPHVALALGPVALLTVPFEPFSIVTLRIKEFSPFTHTLCVGYANGSLSYFPSMDQLIRGGYEVRMFRTINLIPFADDSENHYVKGCLSLLRKLSAEA